MTNFIDISGKAFNTIHAMDASFFAEVNEVVQEEPTDAGDPETLGLLASIGIGKGLRGERAHSLSCTEIAAGCKPRHPSPLGEEGEEFFLTSPLVGLTDLFRTVHRPPGSNLQKCGSVQIADHPDRTAD